jgi:transcriptional regulator with XRE-family HTH domain
VNEAFGRQRAHLNFSFSKLVFHRKIAIKFNPEYPIEPILLECARRIGLSMKCSRHETPETDMSDPHSTENVFRLEDQLLTELDESEIERRIALEKIEEQLYTHQEIIPKMSNTMLMPGLSFGDHKNKKPGLPDSPRKQPSKLKLTPEHEELKSIRQQLGWTQQQFADELGMGLPCLASYEYGRTKGVPEQIINKARNLLEQEASAAKRIKSKFDGRSMESILTEWSQILGLEAKKEQEEKEGKKFNENRELSIATGASIPTIVRWKNGDTRPSVQGLLRYEKRIMDEAAKRNRG